MPDNPLYAFFPRTETIREMRPNQREALDLIWAALDSGHKQITVTAPVGSGKSAIGDTLFNYFQSLGKKCLYTSPLNQLVDQVDSSGFDNVKTLKGRVRYPCLAGKKNAGEGYCQSEKCPSSKRVRDCKHRPFGACQSCVCWQCVYKKAYNAFKNAEKGNTNFSLMLLGVDNSPDVIALDECDVAEGFIRGHYSITIPKLILKEQFRDHVEPLKLYLEELDAQISAIDLQSEAATDEQLKQRKDLLDRWQKISDMLMDVETNKEPWCITVEKDKQKTCYEPITVDRFLEPLLKDKVTFMMSATPPDFPGYHKIEVDSIFPVETRQWSYVPLGKMSTTIDPKSITKSNPEGVRYRDQTIPGLAWWLSQLKGKTIVHCVSYDNAEKISYPLRILGKYPLIQVAGNGNCNGEHTVSRYEAVEALVNAKDKDKILLSVKLDRGIDLWQPDILNNVIAVIPFKNHTLPLVKAKRLLLGKEQEAEEIVRDIAQMIGRIFRNENYGEYNGKKVPKRGYIIPKEWGKFYRKNKPTFPKWFKESELKTN